MSMALMSWFAAMLLLCGRGTNAFVVVAPPQLSSRALKTESSKRTSCDAMVWRACSRQRHVLQQSQGGWFENLFKQKEESNKPEVKEGGIGVVDLKFATMKSGGLKVWLFFWLLGQGKAADNERPFFVRETSDGIRIFIEDTETPGATEYLGVLDCRWGQEPAPFLRIDRIDPAEAVPYEGELFLLDKLLNALLELGSSTDVKPEEKLFTFPEDRNELSTAKGKIAALAAKYS
ncbi:unnamed protein product [Phaeothamnion confervicola]